MSLQHSTCSCTGGLSADTIGETEQRLYGLEAWRETPYYSARERPALEWTEALTLVSETHVPDAVYERVREQFSEDELVHLSLAIGGDQRLEPAQCRCAHCARRLRARRPREGARGELIARDGERTATNTPERPGAIAFGQTLQDSL
jgi:hypothetical protein